MSSDIEPTFHGEIMLAGWRETNNSGAVVSFFLSDPADLDKFRGLTVKKGGVAGQRFMVVMVEIGEDELPVPTLSELRGVANIPDPGPTQPKGGTLSKSAAMLCQDAKFVAYVRHRLRDEGVIWPVDMTAENVCSQALKGWCKVETRAMLDHLPEAQMRFFEVTHDFERWHGARGR